LEKHDYPLFLTPYEERFLLIGGDKMGKPPWGFHASQIPYTKDFQLMTKGDNL